MEKKTLTLIDADSIIFIVAYRFRNKKVKRMVEMQVSKFISGVLTNTGATHYIGFFGSKEANAKPNFRFAIDKNYKGTRPPTPDFITKWRPTILEEFKNKWGFIPVDAMEADDAVAICHNHYKNEFDIINVATADKDLKQLADINFYDFNKHTTIPINSFEAAKNISIQMLMGDTSDNIPGLPGIGKSTAPKLLQNCTTEASLSFATKRQYKEREEVLRSKEQKRILDTIKKSLIVAEGDSLPDDSEYKGLSGARLDRKIRINTVKQLDGYMDQVMTGGWKTYYKQQASLLTMLTEATDDFEIPAVLVNPLADLVDAKPVILQTATIDDFLTI